MNDYLNAGEYVDWQHPAVSTRAAELVRGLSTPEDVIRVCFEWVRDAIRHTGDHNDRIVTCRASDVLREGTGYCYAKSHLLAALLRANGIPAGLCYQRLSRDGDGAPFCLHGLNAVYLEGTGWYRLDPRGNRPDVDARFCPPVERLAFVPDLPGETDLPEIWVEPLPVVVDALYSCADAQGVWQNLPDILPGENICSGPG